MAAAYDVVVVGGGIGGLTVAALLSARGVSTCLLERQSQVGGCIARVEFSGHEFEPGMGVYTSFGAGEIYERIFSELPVDLPQTSLVARPYVVRLADGTDVRMIGDNGFFDELSAAFPECVDRAIEFYRKPALEQSSASAREQSSAGSLREQLSGTSPRFQSFIDGQLRAFLHASIDQCDFATAVATLRRARGPLYTIHGGPATLAERLADSIKQSGGTVRLNTPVLRLAYDTSGAAVGVDLLSGETVAARRAIVSNLTIWDTYGKLVGLNRTPPEIKKMLNAVHGSGAFVVYTTIEGAAVARLPGERLLAISPQTDEDEEFTEFTLAVHGRTATLKSATEVREWFTYHASEEDFEESDQAALERFWTKLHAALPELGADIEVIETTNPRTYYDQTRRKLGMVMGSYTNARSDVQSGLLSVKFPSLSTSVANLFVVSDTVTPSPDLASVVETAASLAAHACD